MYLDLPSTLYIFIMPTFRDHIPPFKGTSWALASSQVPRTEPCTQGILEGNLSVILNNFETTQCFHTRFACFRIDGTNLVFGADSLAVRFCGVGG